MRLSVSKKLSLGAMVTALTVLCLYAASVLPWSKLTCLFLSSLFVYVLAGEGVYGFALIAYAASAGIAFLILPQKEPMFAYAALLGHYGVFKAWADTHIKDGFIRFFLKLLYCNLFTAGSLLLLLRVFDYDIASSLPNWGIWIMVLALECVFIGFELLYSFCVRVYNASLRNQLLPRR